LNGTLADKVEDKVFREGASSNYGETSAMGEGNPMGEDSGVLTFLP